MDVDWNALIGEAASQMIKILVPVLVVLALKWIVEIWKKLSEKNPELAKLIAYAAQIGYAAAEDYFRNIKTATGADKMNFAIFRAKDYLDAAGLHVDDDILKDSITQYGVSNFRFSWTKPTFDLSEPIKLVFPEAGQDPEEEEEDDREPADADNLCVGNCGNGADLDRNQSGEQPTGSDQADAKNQNGK